MIIAKQVTKYFGGFQALKGISFEIGRGEIVGFLGTNGAGKTTLMRILTSYLPATSGRVSIAGVDVTRNSLAIRKKIGYLPETPPLYTNMTTRSYLRFAAQLRDVPIKQQRTQIDKVLTECNLRDVQDKTIGTLSKGYKQRVGIAQAIINDPEVLILDEPTIGLDPVQIIQVRNLIKSLEYERTVILSTHILSEIQQIAQRVLIIKVGEIIVDRSLKELLREQGNQQRVFLRIKGEREQIEQAIKGINSLRQISINSLNNVHSIKLEIINKQEHHGYLCPEGVEDYSMLFQIPYHELTDKVLKANGQILEIREIKSSLEDAFLRIHSAKED